MKAGWMTVGLPFLWFSHQVMAQAADGLPATDAFSTPLATLGSGQPEPVKLHGTVKRIRDTDEFELELPGGQVTRIDLENGVRLREGDSVTVTGTLDHAFDGDKLRLAVVQNPPYARRRAPVDPDQNAEDAAQRDATGALRVPKEDE